MKLIFVTRREQKAPLKAIALPNSNFFLDYRGIQSFNLELFDGEIIHLILHFISFFKIYFAQSIINYSYLSSLLEPKGLQIFSPSAEKNIIYKSLLLNLPSAFSQVNIL